MAARRTFVFHMLPLVLSSSCYAASEPPQVAQTRSWLVSRRGSRRRRWRSGPHDSCRASWSHPTYILRWHRRGRGGRVHLHLLLHLLFLFAHTGHSLSAPSLLLRLLESLEQLVPFDNGTCFRTAQSISWLQPTWAFEVGHGGSSSRGNTTTGTTVGASV